MEKVNMGKQFRCGIKVKKSSVFYPFAQYKFQEKKSKRADTQAYVSPNFGINSKHAT
jgi:hypothetical protein